MSSTNYVVSHTIMHYRAPGSSFAAVNDETARCGCKKCSFRSMRFVTTPAGTFVDINSLRTVLYRGKGETPLTVQHWQAYVMDASNTPLFRPTADYNECVAHSGLILCTRDAHNNEVLCAPFHTASMAFYCLIEVDRLCSHKYAYKHGEMFRKACQVYNVVNGTAFDVNLLQSMSSGADFVTRWTQSREYRVREQVGRNLALLGEIGEHMDAAEFEAAAATLLSFRA